MKPMYTKRKFNRRKRLKKEHIIAARNLYAIVAEHSTEMVHPSASVWSIRWSNFFETGSA